MIVKIPRRQAVFILLLIGTILSTSCSQLEGENSEENASSRYRIEPAFTDTQDMISVLSASNGSYPLGFKPWVNPYENPYGDDVLFREWVIKAIDDDLHRITNRKLGEALVLDVINDGVFDKIGLSPSDDLLGKGWKISTLENAYCTLTTEIYGVEMALDVNFDMDVPTLIVRPVDNTSGQQWKLIQLGFAGDGMCTGVVR